MRQLFTAAAIFLAACTGNKDTKNVQTDPPATMIGDIKVVPIYHGSVLFEANGKSIYFDPWSKGDFTGLPKADLILISDIHQDHLDEAAINLVKADKTVIWGPQAVKDQYAGVTQVIANGETKTWEGISIEAVPMYNIQRGPEPGKLFHDKGRGNGYVLTINNKRIYLSGDTECTPEMKDLKNIDAAFVCMNLPYTMPPEEAVECVKSFRPKTLFPFHHRDSNLETVKSSLKDEKDIEVKILNWY
jgi:L-ascorbate metabolism protein UlaG (beta-lactamase superfamily)